MTPSGHRRCQAPCRAPGTGRVSSSRRAFFVDKLFTIASNLSTKKHLRDFPTILPLVHLDCGRSLAQVWLKLRISLHPPWGALTVAGAIARYTPGGTVDVRGRPDFSRAHTPKELCLVLTQHLWCGYNPKEFFFQTHGSAILVLNLAVEV